MAVLARVLLRETVLSAWSARGPRMKLLLILCIVPAVAFAESGTMKVSPFRDQTPPAVDRNHVFPMVAQTAPSVDRSAGSTGRTPESDANLNTTQFDLESVASCLRESHAFFFDDMVNGNFVVQGSKRDGLRTDYYLIFTKDGAYQLNVSDLPAERPLSLHIKAGAFNRHAVLTRPTESEVPTDKNLLQFQEPEEDVTPQEVSLNKLDWDRNVESQQILSITEYFRSGFAEGIRLASTRVYNARSERLETDLKDSILRAKQSMDEANSVLEQLKTDLKEKRIEPEEYQSRWELARKEHQFWMDAWGALSSRRYHTEFNEFTNDERRSAIADLESQIRLGYLLRGYGACKKILQPALKFLFPEEDKNSLGAYLQQRLLETK